jgi:hypothetical protein
MPENKDVPKAFKRIVEDMDAGKPVKDYKPEVLDAIYNYVKTGKGGDNPVLQKLAGILTGPAPVPAKADDPAEKFAPINDGAKMNYWRGKLVEKLKDKNPEAYSKIQPLLQNLQQDAVTNNSQARHRVLFEHGRDIGLSKDEIKATLGKDYEDFTRVRSQQANFNNGLSENSAETMDKFTWEDMAPTINAGWKDNKGQYYDPTYDGKELNIDTNIPALANLVKKKKPAGMATAAPALAKQYP